MRFAVVNKGDDSVLVTQLGEHWVDVTHAWADYNRSVEQREAAALRDVGDMIAQGLLNRAFYRRISEFVQRHVRLEQYILADAPRFRLPLRPGKVIAIARNYRAHVKELGHDMPTEPMYFAKVASCCIAGGEPIVTQDWYGRVDHEGEIGVVIGKRASRVAAEDAREYVAGYTLVNDVTARDVQNTDRKAGNPWFRAKNMDTFCPLGPTVIPAEAFAWPLEADVELRVNGEVRQKGNTRQFIFALPELIAAITRCVVLEPGDVIATGTPEGVSALKAGDVVELMNAEIGVLRNEVRAG